MLDYEKIYNGPASVKKVDASWERYRFAKESADKMPMRYAWSIEHLFGSVLDVGAGDGYGAYLMTKNKNITSITCLEIQDAAIKKMDRHLRKYNNIRIVKGAIENIDLGIAFNCVHCGHTLEHVEDLEQAMRGLVRHCRDRIVISVPINGGVNRMHLREFVSDEQVISLVEKYFKPIEYKHFSKGNDVYSLVITAKPYG